MTIGEARIISVGHGLEGTPESISEQVWDRRELWSLTLGELRPGLAKDLRDFPPSASVRTTNCLSRAGIRSWASLAQMSISQISAIPNFGRKSLQEVIAFCLVAEGGGPAEAAHDEIDRLEIERQDSEEAKQEEAEHEAELRVFLASLRKATLASGARNLVEAAQRLASDYIVGYSTATQLDRLLDLPAPDSIAWREFFDFPPEELEILDRRVLALERPETLSELSDRFGVTRERIRQRESALKKAITRRLFEEEAFQGIQLMVRRFGGEVETALTQEDLLEKATTKVAGSGIPPDSIMRGAQLLIRFGGPFSNRGNLVMTGEVLSQFDALLEATDAVPFGGLIKGGIVEQLEIAAASDAFPDGWLEEVLGLRTIDDSVVRWGGSMADKARASIAARGVALSLDEIHQLVGFERNPRSLSGQIQNDKRITRQGRDLYGLTEWGKREYLGVEASIAQAIEDAGGSIGIDRLIEELSEEFSIPEESVRSYSSSRRFARSSDGKLELNRHGAFAGAAGDPALTKSLVYRRDGWHLRIEVDEDALRGSGRPISQTAALIAGLDHDVVLGYEYDGDIVTFSWSGRQPSIGSIKSTLDAFGARYGDVLFLPLESPEPRKASHVGLSELSKLSGPNLLGALLGIQDLDGGEKLIEEISFAIGLPRTSEWDEIHERLKARREGELATMVPLR